MTTSAAVWYEDRTPEQWAALAQQYRRLARDSAERSRESFERSDTDGFLSQWAGDTMAQHYRECAALADKRGMAEHRALFDLAGNLVSTRIIDGQYGIAWLTTDEHVAAGGPRYVNFSTARKGQVRYNNLRKKGYTIGTLRVASGVFQRSGAAYMICNVIEPLRDATPEIICTDNGVPEDRD